ncbi:MAG: CRTAC1 family protein, partial [Verrucomicrobiales bacterium]|nr:CRTAC1 family protein [Verrucomicrobiales bacterium]
FSGLDLYLNDGKGRFTDITATLGEDRFSFGMSHTLGDFNGDGRLDLYMTGMGSTTARRLETMKAGRKDFAGHQDHRMKMGYGNRLFLGGKDGFTQAPYNHQVARAGWSWGVAGADFDLDGDRDLFIANGHLSRDSAKDYCTTFWRHDIYSGNSKSNPVLGEFFVDLHKQLHGGCSWNGFEHNVFYLNLPGEGFVNVAFLLGVSHEFDSRVVVGTDFDADGRPDLLVTQLSARTRGSSELLHLIKNNWETSGSWIGVRLQGRPGISPLGAMVKIKTGDKTLIHPITSGDSLWAQHPAIAHFGLGDLKTVELLEINWGNGKTTRIEKPKVNQYHLAQPE